MAFLNKEWVYLYQLRLPHEYKKQLFSRCEWELTCSGLIKYTSSWRTLEPSVFPFCCLSPAGWLCRWLPVSWATQWPARVQHITRSHSSAQWKKHLFLWVLLWVRKASPGAPLADFPFWPNQPQGQSQSYPNHWQGKWLPMSMLGLALDERKRQISNPFAFH